MPWHPCFIDYANFFLLIFLICSLACTPGYKLPRGEISLESLAAKVTLEITKGDKESYFQLAVHKNEFIHDVFSNLKISKDGLVGDMVWAWLIVNQKSGFLTLQGKYKDFEFVSVGKPKKTKLELNQLKTLSNIPITLRSKVSGKEVTDDKILGNVFYDGEIYLLWTHSYE